MPKELPSGGKFTDSGAAMGVEIIGTGHFVPGKPIKNDDLSRVMDTSDEWIRTRTGIRERRFCDSTETSASLGIDASQKALAAAGITADEIDVIICATVTPDHMCPQNACAIHAALGCRPIPAFDLVAACTGFIYSLSVAEHFIRGGSAKNVLVVGADVLSRTIDMTDRNTCILFGDGAGAAVLSARQAPAVGIRSIKIFADGGPGHLITVPGMVTQQPANSCATQHDYIRLNGREVFRFAVRRMIELTQEAILECRELGVELDLLIPHQVNQRIIDAALETTGFPASKVMVNLDKYGNTSAASVPIALDEAIREGRAKTGDTILLVAFGGGLTWGSCIITL